MPLWHRKIHSSYEPESLQSPPFLQAEAVGLGNFQGELGT